MNVQTLKPGDQVILRPLPGHTQPMRGIVERIAGDYAIVRCGDKVKFADDYYVLSKVEG